MTSLTERAELAAATAEGSIRNSVAEGLYREPATAPQRIDMSDYEVGEGDPEMVPVHLAWLRVRKEVGGIAKGELYNAAGTRYNFRGIDTVVQVFGPITMKHGVHVLPVRVDAEHRDTQSSKGNPMRECTVTVTWQIIGPMGDVMQLQSSGEALNSSDKGTAGAQSVALRVLLLTAGLTPTNDPDPDSQNIDRGEAAIRQPGSYVNEITDPRTSHARLRQIYAELKAARQLDALVANENGDDEAIGPMVVRIGTERKAAESGGQL